MKFLLIDDDDVTNYINTRIIKKVYAEAQITIALNGIDAIKALELNAVEGKSSFDVVFVDISMPIMDGWAFIDEVSSAKYELQQKAFYVMLTSSVFDDDVAKAKTKPLIKLFYSKPLDTSRVQEVINAVKANSSI